MLFGQLTALSPGVLVHLKQMEGTCMIKCHRICFICQCFPAEYNKNFVDIHLHAVNFVLQELELPLDAQTKHNYPERILRLQQCQNVIASIIEASSVTSFVTDIRLTIIIIPVHNACSENYFFIREYWNYIQMIKIYIEHVTLPEYPELIVIAKRFELVSKFSLKYSTHSVHYVDNSVIITVHFLKGFGKKCDFSKRGTIKEIQKHMDAIDQNFCKKSNSNKNSKLKYELFQLYHHMLQNVI